MREKFNIFFISPNSCSAKSSLIGRERKTWRARMTSSAAWNIEIFLFWLKKKRVEQNEKFNLKFFRAMEAKKQFFSLPGTRRDSFWRKFNMLVGKQKQREGGERQHAQHNMSPWKGSAINSSSVIFMTRRQCHHKFSLKWIARYAWQILSLHLPPPFPRLGRASAFGARRKVRLGRPRDELGKYQII